jgi:hypothetical protein
MEYETVVKQFLSLGIHGTKAATGIQTAGSSSRHAHKLAGEKSAMKKNKARAKSSTYVNCRFVPKVKELVEQVLTNVVDNSEFPLIGTGSANYSVGSSAETASPTRSMASMWGQNKAAADGQQAEEREGADTTTGSCSNSSNRRQKIVIFVIGGITLAETRAVAELEKQFNCDVLIGGSCVLTPKRLFEILLAPTPIL